MASLPPIDVAVDPISLIPVLIAEYAVYFLILFLAVIASAFALFVLIRKACRNRKRGG